MSGEDIAGAFRGVDEAADAARLAGYLDRAAASPFYREVKERTLAALALGPGDRALDVGCGLGGDVRAMAGVVGPSGRAVGIDASERFLAMARERTPPGAPVDLVLGDAAALPFPDRAFAGVREERTLQHVRDPAAAMAEMARVGAPGGRVAVWEGDWDTLIANVEPLRVSRLVCRRRAAAIRHPDIGRRLAGLMGDAGLLVTAIEPLTYVMADLADAEEAYELAAEAGRCAADGALPAEEAEAWRADLRRRGGSGRLFVAITGFLVVGRRPA